MNAVSERRPHWDDALIEAVRKAYARPMWHDDEQDFYPFIEAVEGWFRQNAHMPMVVETCEQAEALRQRAEATVQRVREVCGDELDEGTGYMRDERAIGRNVLRGEILDALDSGGAK